MLSSRSRSTAALLHRTPRLLLAAGVVVAAMAVAPVASADPVDRPQLPAAGPLLQDPSDPTTADEAQQAWLDATQRAEAMNEKVLVARDAETKAKQDVVKARALVESRKQALQQARRQDAAAAALAAQADGKLRSAAAAEADYQSQVDDFADASFRGARFGSVAALLTATSPDEFLDTASTLDAVADDSAQTLQRAAQAKATAASARTEADRTAAAATSARSTADAALRDAGAAQAEADAAASRAHRATVEVTSRQRDLTAEADRLKQLQQSLSEQERQAALEAQARQLAAAAAQQQAAADRNRQAAPAQQAPAQAAPEQQAPAPQVGTASSTSAAPTTSEQPAAAAPSSAAQIAVQAALSKVGSPYVFGSAGPDTFDCSGLTSWAWAQAGVTIPRTSSGQNGLPYVPLDQLQPGDLVTYYSPVHHVAMYIGNGQIVHASTSSKPVYVTSLYYGGPNPTGHRVTG